MAVKTQWQPLMNTLMSTFMFMGYAKTPTGVQIHLYKHIWTRRYINLDNMGQAYHYENGGYRPVQMVEALSHVFS